MFIFPNALIFTLLSSLPSNDDFVKKKKKISSIFKSILLKYIKGKMVWFFVHVHGEFQRCSYWFIIGNSNR